MAPTRSKPLPKVGSAQWILAEKEQIQHLADQDAEEFAFSARNEMEWLNEHLAEIFDENQIHIAEIFKTPGKLRGKTPRTVRQRDAFEARAPLTDKFATKQLSVESPPRKTQFSKQVARFQVAEDPVQSDPSDKKEPVKLPLAGKLITDSGYHGTSDDEMDVEPVIHKPEIPQVSDGCSAGTVTGDEQRDVQMSLEEPTQDHAMTHKPYHPEEVRSQKLDEKLDSQVDMIMDTVEIKKPLSIDSRSVLDQHRTVNVPAGVPEVAPREALMAGATAPNPDKDSVLEDVQTMDDLRSPSEGSSPVRALVRKSSLTFASLPAREPLATKKSIGGRAPQANHSDQSKVAANSGESNSGKQNGEQSLEGVRPQQVVEEVYGDIEMDVDDQSAQLNPLATVNTVAHTTTTDLHNKSSTQRLHDRINMLGQSHPSRPTKSIPSIANVAAHLNYPDLPRAESELPTDTLTGFASLTQASGRAVQRSADDEDDWIQPPQKRKGGKGLELAKGLSRHETRELVAEHTSSSQEAKFSVVLSNNEDIQQTFMLGNTGVPARPMNTAVYVKSTSTSVAPSSSKPASAPEANGKRSPVASNPDLAAVQGDSTTPAGSPKVKNGVEGLSASKARLQSIMKGARGLFTSSAGISAQAKLETIYSGATRIPSRSQMSPTDELLGGKDAFKGAGKVLDTIIDTANVVEASIRPDDGSESALVRRTRSSTERERQKTVAEAEPNQLTVAQESKLVKKGVYKITKEIQISKPTRQSPRTNHASKEQVIRSSSPETTDGDVEMDDCPKAMAPPPSRNQRQVSQSQKTNDVRRPMRPAKETLPKPKPQPVAIRVGTLSQRVPLTNSTLSSTLQDSLPPPAPSTAAQQSTITKKHNVQPVQSSFSSSNLKTSVSSVPTKPKALLAAEKKKEQDEREARRKLDMKREIERKRALHQEEARKLEQLKEADRQREKDRALVAEDPKKIAQKQAIEQRRLENARKAEQQRNMARSANDLGHAIQQEKAQPAAAPRRGELGNTKPPSRMNSVQDFSRLAATHALANATKPTKRPADEESYHRPGLSKVGTLSHANDAKRRRTEEEDMEDAPIRPTMAPPIRQSNVRKDAPKPSIFAHGYTAAAAGPSIAVAATSSLKPTTNNQFHLYQQQQSQQLQTSKPVRPMDMASRVTGKIPFAEAPNPPHHTFQTPLQMKQPSTSAIDSSPECTEFDDISLPEIDTDDDEDGSDDGKPKKNGFVPPDWAKSPQLQEILERQQLIDPATIFGSIKPPNLEKMFPDKSRHHHFRQRTSSANWTKDGLTQEEIRADFAAREKMMRQGYWSADIMDASPE